MKYKIEIPTSLDDITLAQFKEYSLMISRETEEDLTFKKQVINLFCTGDTEKIEFFKKKQIDSIFADFNEMLESERNIFEKIISIDGKEYGFIPNLKDLSIGEFSDIETLMKDGVFENIEKVLAVLFRPVINKVKHLYNIADYDGLNDRDKLFLNKFPVKNFHGTMVFFLIIAKELLMHTHQFLKENQQTENKSSKPPLA
tara:strand:+ start:293 stop:892 length:600 start_codon:yes stop_codon:yes gene_type:complete